MKWKLAMQLIGRDSRRSVLIGIGGDTARRIVLGVSCRWRCIRMFCAASLIRLGLLSFFEHGMIWSGQTI